MMSCSFPPTNVNSSFPLRKLLRKTDEARAHGNVGNCEKANEPITDKSDGNLRNININSNRIGYK